jgi:hypothetical protein
MTLNGIFTASSSVAKARWQEHSLSFNFSTEECLLLVPGGQTLPERRSG